MLVKLPQLCMNEGLDSCHHATHQANRLEYALRSEFNDGREVVDQERLDGRCEEVRWRSKAIGRVVIDLKLKT